MAYRRRPMSSPAAEMLHRSRMSQVDYINYIHAEYKPIITDKFSLDSKPNRTEAEDVEYYLGQLCRILLAQPNYGTPPEPARIYDNVYVGTTSNADNLALLRRHKIKYLLNCAGIPALRPDREIRHYKNPESGVVEYEEIHTKEGETYDISQHFLKAHTFIEHARKQGAVLLFCPDVNPSGAIAISYLIRKGYSLLQAAKLLKDKRKSALFNKGFMRRLVLFARDRGLLEKSASHLGAIHLEGLTRVKERPPRSHLLAIR